MRFVWFWGRSGAERRQYTEASAVKPLRALQSAILWSAIHRTCVSPAYWPCGEFLSGAVRPFIASPSRHETITLPMLRRWRSYHEAICDEGAALLDSDSPTLTSSPSTAARSDSPAPADQASPQLRPATASPGCWYGSDYPCPPASAWLRMCFHALRPGVLYFVPFFRPPNPADLHDGLSMAFFMVGAVLCLWLGPPTAAGRRSSNLVRSWEVPRVRTLGQPGVWCGTGSPVLNPAARGAHQQLSTGTTGGPLQ